MSQTSQRQRQLNPIDKEFLVELICGFYSHQTIILIVWEVKFNRFNLYGIRWMLTFGYFDEIRAFLLSLPYKIIRRYFQFYTVNVPCLKNSQFTFFLVSHETESLQFYFNLHKVLFKKLQSFSLVFMLRFLHRKTQRLNA